MALLPDRQNTRIGGYASSHGCQVNCVCDQQTVEGAGPDAPGEGSAWERD